MASPYDNLPEDAFWRNAVAERAPLTVGDLYQPKLRITLKTPIATAGSCFAQHVNRALRAAGYNVLDMEPLHCSVPDVVANAYGYRLYSARYGNIYTVRQMLQLVQQAFGLRDPSAKVWERDGRYFDALRPGIEPQGLGSPEEVERHRQEHLAAVRTLFEDCGLFIFTLGLTETWIDQRDGTVYPTAPGVIAGDWNPEEVAFHNFTFREMLNDFLELRDILRKTSFPTRFILTVSPVPLTATASGKNVEVANSYSKSTLRALCGWAEAKNTFIDYFPSYEIITSAAARGAYFEANLRNVSTQGVAAAMSVFLSKHDQSKKARDTAVSGLVNLPGTSNVSVEEAYCDDAMLEAFGK